MHIEMHSHGDKNDREAGDTYYLNFLSYHLLICEMGIIISLHSVIRRIKSIMYLSP